MKHNHEPAGHRPKSHSRRSRFWAGALAFILLSPLLLLARHRKALIPESGEGFSPIAQFTGSEHVVPRFKLALPAEKNPEPKKEAPAASLASAVNLPAWAPAPAPHEPAPIVSAPRVRAARTAARPAKKRLARKTKPAPRRPVAKAVVAKRPPEPVSERPAAEPAPPARQEKPPARSAVRGRRAQPPPELELPGAPEEDAPAFIIGQRPGIIIERQAK